MVRNVLVRLLCPIVGIAAAVAGWDAEAGHRRSRHASCCEPCCEVVYETARPACPTVCAPACPAPACPAPCAPVTCCAPRHVHYAQVVIEQEVIVPAASCCAAVTPSPVIVGTVVVRESMATPAPTAQRGRLIAAPVSRRLR